MTGKDVGGDEVSESLASLAELERVLQQNQRVFAVVPPTSPNLHRYYYNFIRHRGDNAERRMRDIRIVLVGDGE